MVLLQQRQVISKTDIKKKSIVKKKYITKNQNENRTEKFVVEEGEKVSNFSINV